MATYASQRTLRLVLVGLVSLAAISMGAATIDSTVEVGTPGQGEPVEPAPGDSSNVPGVGTEDNASGVTNAGENNASSGVVLDLARCEPLLDSTPGTIAYFAGFLALIYLIKRRYALGAALLSSYGLAPIVLTAYFLNTNCASAGGPGVGDGGDGPGIGDGGSSVVPAPDVSPVWLAGVLVLMIVAAAAVMIRASGDQEFVAPDDEDEAETETDVADLAAAAGAAADRLEKHNADVDNAVYRAWWEMTRLLDVPQPDSATPGEFAEAAIDVGLGEGHVNELTRLFEEVRYGKRDAESRESHAIEVFRTIEAEYGTESETPLDVDGSTDVDAGSGDDTTQEGDDGR